ncbi:DM13 domain-containing protein [Aeromonas hydrophila]|uniref:DM13 domain-containing protein n=1 Tax=Aeromonas hydrophila TaxID=644 RepID=UPI001C5B29B8|nr:DM13 domain-containing protein [Aeromonas hydrophila]MBW3810029.1 DM13 domain-containing protein [Aeromonas hydrophila]
MQRKTLALLLASHLLVGAVGFAAGIYALPILIAPPAPANEQVAARQAQAGFHGTFRRDLQDSDRLHWGEGQVSIGPDAISLMGKLAPGPDYQLYLSPTFVETEADFARLKENMVKIGPVKTFDNFIVPLPADVNPADYDSVIVWCETFGQFITAARYRQ